MSDVLDIQVASEYMLFERSVFGEDRRKTGVWYVKSKRSSDLLGIIKWYGPWRQYTFWPAPGTIFNRGCLSDINLFIETAMSRRRAGT